MAHSKKPAQVMDLIVELFGDVPRLEMFARESSPGWDCFGYQASGGIEINEKARG